MSRRVRLLALLLVALVVVAAVALVLTSRPQLDDDRDRVDDVWTEALRTPLADRYLLLSEVVAQLRDAGAGDRDVTRALARELDRWDELRRADPDVAAEVEAANRLEGLAARAGASIAASPRLSAAPPLTDALAAFGKAAPPAPQVQAYNDAAEAYQQRREELRYRLVARVFGYDPLPTLLLG